MYNYYRITVTVIILQWKLVIVVVIMNWTLKYQVSLNHTSLPTNRNDYHKLSWIQ